MENIYPVLNEIVIGKVIHVNDIRSKVLLEKYNKEALILHSELCKRRISNLEIHINEGDVQLFQVIRVDKEKGYIDLSKKYLPNGMNVTYCASR